MKNIPDNRQPLDLEKYLTHVAACCRNFGYVSSQDAQAQDLVIGTGELAWKWATEGRAGNEILKQANMNLQDRQAATDTAKWMGDQYHGNAAYRNKWKEIFREKKIFWNETVYAASAFAVFMLGIEPEGLAEDKVLITEESKARAVETVEKISQPTLEDAISALMDRSPDKPVVTVVRQQGTPTQLSQPQPQQDKVWNTPAAAASASTLDTMRPSDKSSENIHLGVVGHSYGCIATLVRIHGYQGKYGEGFFYNFQDLDGNWLVWSTNKTKQQLSIDVGSRVYIQGTIKKHSDWKGTKQTEITRCTVTLP